MQGREERKGRLSEGGFTIVEVLVYLFVAVLVVAGVYNLMIGQNRLYMKQRELQDVRTSLRAAANLLAFEFRQASAAGGDLDSINTYDIILRSVQGSGVVCGIHNSSARLGLYNTGGDFTATTDDSAMVFVAGSAGTGDDGWFVGGVAGKYDPSAGGVPDCQWSGVSLSPDLVVAIDTPLVALAGIEVGAPYRQFRMIHYGLYLDADGRWWLGRKIGGAASWERLTGPLGAPSDSGLALLYYDASGTPTTDPTLVRMVDIVLRGESYGKVPTAGGGPVVQEDTLTLRVSLRG